MTRKTSTPATTRKPAQVKSAGPAPTKAGRKPAKAKPAPKATPTEVEPTPEPATFRLCGCGCGDPVVTKKARFLSGHDARWAGMVGRGEVEAPSSEDDRLTDKMVAKIEAIRETAKRKEAAKAAKVAAKAAADKAYAEALATA